MDKENGKILTSLLLDDINTDFVTKRYDILQHAAEISPQIHERTIGSDIVEKKIAEKENDQESLNESINISEIETKLSPTTSNTIFNVSSIKNLDLQTVAESSFRREAERCRSKSIRNHLVELQEKQQHNFLKSQNKILEGNTSTKTYDNWLNNKLNDDALILSYASKSAEIENKDLSDQLDLISNQKNNQLQVILIQGVLQFQRKFRLIYEYIVNLLSLNETKINVTEYNDKLKQYGIHFEQLFNKIKKTNSCGLQELITSEKLYKNLQTLHENIVSDLQNIDQEKQQQELLQNQKQQQELLQQQHEQQQLLLLQNQKIQEELKQQQHQPQPPPPPQQQQQETTNIIETVKNSQDTIDNTTTTANNNNEVSNTSSSDCYKFYTDINIFYQDKLEKVKPLQADELYKKFRSACHKAINIPINAISSVNREHLHDKFEKLYSLISGQLMKTTDGQFSINEHPFGRDYCVLLMAKKFVNQGDTAISSNPQAAFPVASIIVTLWKLVPDFGRLFLAYTYKDAPFLVPYFFIKRNDQSDEEYYKLIGYRVADNKIEPHEMYLKRLAGITRLYAAIMVTSSAAQLDAIPHPYNIEHAWRFLANFILLDPLPDISATILLEFLQIVSPDLYNNYGKQFVKLLIYIQQQYFPKLMAVDAGGPRARLELLLNKYLHDRQISKAEGMLPPGFW